MTLGAAWRRGGALGLPPVLTFNLGKLSFAEGLRAGFALAAVVLLYQWARWPGLMEAALAALLTCICDAGGPLRRRLPAVLVFGVLGAAITGAFAMLRDAPLAVVVPLSGLCVFATAFARAFGTSAMQVGNLLSVVLALTLRQSGPRPDVAWTTAATFLGGSLWAMALTVVIWRLHPYRPARMAVAAPVHALARMAADLRSLAAAAGPPEALWDRHARAYRHEVRERLAEAREAVLATVRVRGPAAGPAAQSWLRLEAADQLFGALIALSDLLSGDPPPPQASALRVLRLVAGVLRVLEREVLRDTTRLRPGLERAIAAIPRVAREGVPVAEFDTPAARLAGLAEIIAERLRATLSPTQGPDRLPVVPARRWRDVIRANLGLRSLVLRHALRTALVAMGGFAVMLVWPAPYLHWFAITLIVTLQPYVAVTAVRAIERVGGTVLGGMLAAAIGLVCTTPLGVAAALFPLSVAALTVRAVSFGLFMTALTPVVVLLSEIGQPGISGPHIAWLRALWTLAGGVCALLANLLLWPTFEPRLPREQMHAALRAHGRYAGLVIGERLGETEATEAAVEAARREAGTASNAFEASLQRGLLERGLRARGALTTMLTVDAALRRLAGRLSTMHLQAPAPVEDPAAWRALREWIGTVTERLGDGAAAIPSRPSLADEGGGDGPLSRLARPLELAAGAVLRAEDQGAAGAAVTSARRPPPS